MDIDDTPSGVNPETWAKMDRFDRQFYRLSVEGNLPESQRKEVGWSIYDHEADGKLGCI